MFNLTDRVTEQQVRDNAAFQLFCSYGLIKKWHAPNHTKIEAFRSRLSPETQRRLANLITQQAVNLFGNQLASGKYWALRRAGIEPLIGHTKHGGQLGRSSMKSDETIKSAGYAAVFGFNRPLRKLPLISKIC